MCFGKTPCLEIETYPHFQWIFQERKHPMLVCLYSRGAGKTFAATDWCITRLLQDPNPIAQALIISNDLTKTKDLFAQTLARYEPLAQRKMLTYNSVTGKVSIKLNPKSKFLEKTIVIGSYRQEDTIRGYHPTYIVLDEAKDMNQATYEQVIIPLMRDMEKGGQFLVVGTPKGTNNVLYNLFLKGQDPNNPDVKSVKKTVYDINLSERQIEFFKNSVSPLSFRQEFLCDASVNVTYGDIYNDIIERLETSKLISDNIQWDPSLPVNLAFDLGFNDATACWFWQVTQDHKINVIDYLEVRHKFFPEIIMEIRKKQYFHEKYNYCILPHDCVQHHISGGGYSSNSMRGVNVVHDYKEYDKNTVYGMAKAEGWKTYIVPRTNSVASCITPCREFLKKCRFNKTNCALGLQHLSTYQYEFKVSRNPNKKGELEATNVPEEYGEHLHCCDAFRYMAMSENIWNKEQITSYQNKQRRWSRDPFE